MVTAILVLAALLILYLITSAYIVMRGLRLPRLPVAVTPKITHENVSFASRIDRLTLRGWYFPSGDHCIVVVSGGGQNRVDPVVGTLVMARDMVAKGYSVLLFDQRGRGESDGRALPLIHVQRDIGAAVDFARSRGHSRVSVIGFSAGAAASLTAAEGITALVLDNCFASISEMIVTEAVLRGWPAFLARVARPGMLLMTRIVHGEKFVNPEDRIGDVDCPVLIVHGEADEDVPVSNAYRLYNASRDSTSELWTVPNAGHCLAYRSNPAGYVERITAFLSDHATRDRQV